VWGRGGAYGGGVGVGCGGGGGGVGRGVDGGVVGGVGGSVGGWGGGRGGGWRSQSQTSRPPGLGDETQVIKPSTLLTVIITAAPRSS